jgi:DNA-binding winged helix-turn-helix (wHTH) protein
VTSYEFVPFRLDPARRRLSREGEPLAITPKAFDVLLSLVQNRDRVMERAELLRRAWPDTNVEEANLSQNVFTLRKALGDNPERARFIATVPKRGYRFIAEVRELRNGDEAAAASSAAKAGPGPDARRSSAFILVGLAFLVLPVLGFLAGRRKANPAGPTKKKRGRCAAPLHGNELRTVDD